MASLDDLVALYQNATGSGYVLLPDDYTALGYMAMAVNDYRRVLFVVAQANDALTFTDRTIEPFQMAKYEDGTYGIR